MERGGGGRFGLSAPRRGTASKAMGGKQLRRDLGGSRGARIHQEEGKAGPKWPDGVGIAPPVAAALEERRPSLSLQ
ncbi:hypothetical protein NDU88_006567 [Pleurodeles waltl]|uniref:Uncharacterized protein n=1 Tax=Pleurodeles waltl TaxID=8319 RepID=A0AAV7WDZ6_PLEWA|nr:hypothetical protein NDU88_006567 [Pleurodeles waltl]